MSAPTPKDLLIEAAFNSALADIATKRTGTLDGDVGQLRDGIVRICKVLTGVHEDGTTNSSYWVDKFTADTKAKRQSWCLSFVQFVVRNVCEALGRPDVLPYDTAGTQALAAWAIKGGHEALSRDPKRLMPQDGFGNEIGIADIFIWQQKADPIHGHTGFLTGFDGTGGITATEGNTSSKADSRDGGTVAEKHYSNGTGASQNRRLRAVVSLYSLAAKAWHEEAQHA